MRVSTLDQNEQRQLDGVDVDRSFFDKASGKDTKRPQLEAMLAFVREGDTVICHSMDRLARNLDDLRKIVLGLTGRGVQVQFVKESLTSTGADSPMANLLLSVMGAFSEFERARKSASEPSAAWSSRAGCARVGVTMITQRTISTRGAEPSRYPHRAPDEPSARHQSGDGLDQE